MRKIIGAVLVGGQSTRMGRNKATLTLPSGCAMVDVVAAALFDVCSEVVFVGGPDTRITRPEALHVADLRHQAGPLGGIEALLASGLAHDYLVCPCDLPRITPDVLRMLLVHRERIATVFRIAGNADVEPLPARIAATALPVARRLLDEGTRSVWKLMRTLPASVVELDAHLAGVLTNVNTPDDLNML